MFTKCFLSTLIIIIFFFYPFQIAAALEKDAIVDGKAEEVGKD